MATRRIGLLGGTFNPVHRGHIELGLNIGRDFGLERILYILSARPPHKRRQPLPPAKLRFAILKKALRPYPRLQPCDIELHRPEYSWTVDTLDRLKEEFSGCAFYFITGSEGFLKIRTWKEYQRVLHSVIFIIVLRTPSHRRPVSAILAAERIPLLTSPGQETGLPPGAFLHSYPADFLSLSSTLIRKKIVRGEDIRNLVGSEVRTMLEVYKPYEAQ